jgi:hypothetical protein
MSGARVDSIDALRHFRVAIIKFAEAANVALSDSEGEVSRTLMWLQMEQPAYWEGQIRKRHEMVQRCKEAVRQKKLFKDSTGRTQSAVDEEKRLAIAQRKLADAEQRLANTKRHSARLQKEYHMFKGAVMRLTTNVGNDLPNAVATLDRMAQSLDAYVSLTTTAPAAGTEVATSAGGMESSAGNMARSDVEEMPQPEETAEPPDEKEPEIPA